MNLTPLLARARKELENARVRALHDGKAAQAIKQTAVAAKVKLKQARKLAKFTKRAARKAEDRAGAALEALEIAQARLEKLEKRARKKARKQAGAAKPAPPAKPVARTRGRAARAKAASSPPVRPKAKPKAKKSANARPTVSTAEVVALPFPPAGATRPVADETTSSQAETTAPDSNKPTGFGGPSAS